ncbi:hypothetical protein LWI28_001029 [Acer negundo]|uniref:Uncharacterized protein n=1 Tax=Acer negundo TaxID=4023 RepID=A0AAD5NPI3_ACENE|nr:hypothetical protein LWI28_001029 [Acer negundo]
MFMVDIAGEEDRHLRAAELPQFSPDICIIESTYGVQLHQPRHIREKHFTEVFHTTVSQGGRVLIPAFALGRAQELLLILDEYWSNHPELHNIPIYYASPLAKKCSSVVMASPGGLQSGLSRQLFDIWCYDKKNACVIPGYVVEGTLAKTIISEPKEVTLLNGLTAPLNMQVHYISFSAHADYAQTSTFLKEHMPPNIILVHGESHEMGRLKTKLMTELADCNTKIITPKNCQSVEMNFNSEKMAKTIGRLAEKTPEVGETDIAILVKKGFTYQIMAPDDLHIFSQLSTAYVTTLVPLDSEKHISMHWTSDPVSDMVSDSIVALVLNISREMPKVVVESEAMKSEEESGKKAEKVINALLVSLFGDVKLGENGKLVIKVDGIVAHLDKQNGDIESENQGLKERVRTAYMRIQCAVKPIPLSADK